MKNQIMNAETIGDRLRLLRGDRTIAEVSKATGLSQSRIGNYERGVRLPNDSAKSLLANFYGVSIQKLFYTEQYNAK